MHDHITIKASSTWIFPLVLASSSIDHMSDHSANYVECVDIDLEETLASTLVLLMKIDFYRPFRLTLLRMM